MNWEGVFGSVSLNEGSVLGLGMMDTFFNVKLGWVGTFLDGRTGWAVFLHQTCLQLTLHMTSDLVQQGCNVDMFELLPSTMVQHPCKRTRSQNYHTWLGSPLERQSR